MAEVETKLWTRLIHSKQTKGHQMSKATKETTSVAKSPKTIKVSTVIIAVAVTVALIASFIGGIAFKTHDQNRVEASAKSLVSSLK